MLYAVVPIQADGDQITALRKRIESLVNSNGPSTLMARENDVRVYIDAAPDLYFVVYPGTSRALADDIGYGNNPDIGLGVVIQVSSYYGYASSDIWDWLRMQHGR